MGSILDHRIKYDEQLSHAGNLNDEVRFASVFESFCERDKNGVESSCVEGSHIECGANKRSSSRNTTSSFEFSAVVVIGRDTGKRGDLCSVDGSQFGDFGEEMMSRLLTDTWHTGEDVAFGFPFVVRVNERCDGFFDGLELLIKEGNGLLDGISRDLSIRRVLSVRLDRSKMKNLSSTCDKILQFLLVFRRFYAQRGFDDFGEHGEITGVDGIGLGTMSEPLREVPGLSRIDDGDWYVGLKEMKDKQSLIVAGGLDGE